MSNWKQTLRRLGVDKKKASVMIVLMALGMLLWGRLLLKDVPRTAVADPQAGALVAAVTPPPPQVVSDRLTVRVDLPRRLLRDPFVVDGSRYQTREVPDFSQTPEKSPAISVDVNPRQAAARAGLVLQSTILGDQPKAMISGNLLAPGDKLHGFVLKAVQHRRVVLEYSGIQLELEMK